MNSAKTVLTIGAAVALTGGLVGVALAGSKITAVGGILTLEDAMLSGQTDATGNGWTASALVTIGEETFGADYNEAVYGYRPVGILDGIGAFATDGRVVRVLVNHELDAETGYAYQLANGTPLTGARVSFFEIDRFTRKTVCIGPAYDTIIDRTGTMVVDASQINEGNNDGKNDGMDRLCSSYGIAEGEYGFEADVYFTGEEVSEFGSTPEEGLGGQEYVVDVDGEVAYAVPMLGRAAFENVSPVTNFDTDKVVIVIGDDRQAAPLYLYIGEKGAAPAEGYDPPQFLIDNGLGDGRLFVWVADNGDTTPEDFNGTFESRTGRFVRIEHFEPEMAGQPNYDGLGFASLALQDQRSQAVGGFQFSRPEDVGVNPADGTQVAFASTGRGALFPSDNWGTTYIIDLDDEALESALALELEEIDDVPAELTIIYDGDDAGAGQFEDPDFGLRSPDNLDWADDGLIYVQEDRSTSPSSLFGGTSGIEASVWRIDPATGELMRIMEMDRAWVPVAQSDPQPTDIGNWESSGVLDVTDLFETVDGETLLIVDVQAHSLVSEEGVGLARNASQGDDLVQGGQLLLLSNAD